jgi:hypothetical protein
MGHWVEATLLGVPFIAAVIYLVVEILDFKIWWNKRRQPKPPPEYAPRMKDTWPDYKEMECADEWERMLEDRQDA